MNVGVDGGSPSPLPVFQARPACLASAVMGRFTLLPGVGGHPFSRSTSLPLSASPHPASTSLLDLSLLLSLRPAFLPPSVSPSVCLPPLRLLLCTLRLNPSLCVRLLSDSPK